MKAVRFHRNLANAARLRKSLIEGARLGAPDASPADSTFEACCNGFLRDKALELKPSTVSGYQSKLETYWSDLAERPVRGIRLADLREIDRAITWSSQKTRRDAHAVLRGVLQWAIGEELADDNPARRLSVGEWQRPDIDPMVNLRSHATRAQSTAR